MLNAQTLNSRPLNAGALSKFFDWEKVAPVQRQSVYLFEVSGVRIPISSFQATMRNEGQSYLQAIVPAGTQFADVLAGMYGATMEILKGYRYPDDSLSPLEAIATAPLELIRGDEGPSSDSLSLSGYGQLTASTPLLRQLRNVRYRSVNDGVRRVRCDIDLFLRPGHTATDSDGFEFSVATIQYYVGTRSDFMEVIEDG